MDASLQQKFTHLLLKIEALKEENKQLKKELKTCKKHDGNPSVKTKKKEKKTKKKENTPSLF